MLSIFKAGFLLFVVQFVDCGVLPVGKCNLEDSTCMTAAYQTALPVFASGLPELGVEVLDVMNMDDFAFDLAGLQFSLKNGTMKGFKSTIVDNVKWNLKRKTIQLSFHIDCTIKGHYTAGGRIIILPIAGDGQMKLKLKNVQVEMLINFEVEKDSEGKDHIIPKKYSFDFDVKGNGHFHLSNLFNGNKELSDPVLKFLNTEWKQVSVEFGRPVLNAVAKKIFKSFKSFMEHVPIADIANY